MIAAAGLVAYASLLLICGPAALARTAWPVRAPRLAIAVWLALAWSAVTSIVLAGVALTIPALPPSTGVAGLLADCAMELRAQYGHPGGAPLARAGAVLAVTVTARLAWCTAATLAGQLRAGRRHRRGLRLAGRADARLGAIVVDHAEPAAYCLSGRRQPVVLTSATLSVLDDAQVSAVLAHERAHQAGRHHLLIAAAASLAASFPLPAFRRTRDEVTRLAELAADDAAAVRSPRLVVAEALLTLGTAPAVAATLGAGGSTAAARVRRLIAAPNPLTRVATAGGALAVTAMVVLPAMILAGPAVAAVLTGYCTHPAVAVYAAGLAR